MTLDSQQKTGFLRLPYYFLIPELVDGGLITGQKNDLFQSNDSSMDFPAGNRTVGFGCQQFIFSGIHIREHSFQTTDRPVPFQFVQSLVSGQENTS
ncbi:hypothetical protein SDC9_166472 [bioreactor metagenome]|uniref:Uncharacterized protein n=1 Tax=bioreactor metagenome TaxID=1076179 RepID=A0A645FYW2_9ZZZZ